MRVCGRCCAAENPKSKVVFVDSPEGVLCSDCYKAYYSFPSPSAERNSPLVVIICPDCRGNHHAPRGNKCPSCAGYGSVRIAANALPVYAIGETRQSLTE